MESQDFQSWMRIGTVNLANPVLVNRPDAATVSPSPLGGAVPSRGSARDEGAARHRMLDIGRFGSAGGSPASFK